MSHSGREGSGQWEACALTAGSLPLAFLSGSFPCCPWLSCWCWCGLELVRCNTQVSHKGESCLMVLVDLTTMIMLGGGFEFVVASLNQRTVAFSVHREAASTHGGFPWCFSPCTREYAVLANSAFWIPGLKLSPHPDCKQKQVHLPRCCLYPACLPLPACVEASPMQEGGSAPLTVSPARQPRPASCGWPP